MTEGMSTAQRARCGRCESPLEVGDIRCAICALPRPPGEATAGAVVAEVLRCEGCGAALEYDVRAQAPRCAFCGSVAHLERSEDPIERAERYLPFRVDRPDAQAALRGWLSSLGWFRPSDLASSATLEQLTPLWFVAWTFDCDALVSWTADSDAGSGRSAWAPHAGQFPVTMRSVLVSASRGLREAEVAQLAGYFDLATAQREPHGIEGAVIERFDVQRSAARGIIASALDRTAAGEAKPHIPGRKVRNLRVSALLRGFSTQRLALPSWVLAYRYRGTLHRAVVHGQDPRVVLGEAPYSIWKILAVVLGVLGALTGLCLFASLVLALAS